MMMMVIINKVPLLKIVLSLGKASGFVSVLVYVCRPRALSSRRERCELVGAGNRV